MANVGGKLSIRRVVGALHPDDALIEIGGMLLYVPEEVQLRHRGSNQQDRLGTCKRGNNVAEETGLVVRMIARPRLHVFGMSMHVLVGRQNRRLIEIRLGDVKDPGLIVINPHR